MRLSGATGMRFGAHLPLIDFDGSGYSLDVLSGGRLVAGLGPGSSRADYEAVGLDFEERWRRFDEAILAVRALWSGANYHGHFYSTEGLHLEPQPAQTGRPPIWLGSWGSP